MAGVANPVNSAKNIRVAIVGDGPAGSLLASHLARASVPVCQFSAGVRPPLVVGESLVPAIVPLLRELNLEEEVRSYSTLKPGASFFLHPDKETTINFARAGVAGGNYSYNVPRPRFDQSLLDCAIRSGCKLIETRAELAAEGDQLKLLGESHQLACEALGGEPDLIVDASGRQRLSARLLGIGEISGNRKDTALFAHLEGVELLRPGNIHINRLRHGWSWRIPLPHCVSVGVVIANQHRQRWGSNSEEQYDRLIAEEPVLSRHTAGAKRLTQVMKYNNYQLTSDRFFGSNWVTVGDSAGFIDPIFSSGLIVGLSGAKYLASAILAGASQAQLASYERFQRTQLMTWQTVVDSFYNGHLFGLMRAGDLYANHFLWGKLTRLFERNIMPIFSGALRGEGMSFKFTSRMLNSNVAGKFGHRLKIG